MLTRRTGRRRDSLKDAMSFRKNTGQLSAPWSRGVGWGMAQDQLAPDADMYRSKWTNQEPPVK